LTIIKTNYMQVVHDQNDDLDHRTHFWIVGLTGLDGKYEGRMGRVKTIYESLNLCVVHKGHVGSSVCPAGL